MEDDEVQDEEVEDDDVKGEEDDDVENDDAEGEEDGDTEEEETDHKTAPHSFCEPAHSKCMSRFHKSHFRRKFAGKLPQPRLGPEHGHTHFEPLYMEI